MTDLEVIPVKRVISRDESKEIKGNDVPDLEANVTKAGIYVDAETNEPFLVYCEMPADAVPH